MSEIKNAIVLSDLHLGRDLSYLYSKDLEFANNKKVLKNVLEKVSNSAKTGVIDELIINGDFLELSLGDLNEVYHDAKQFFQLISEAAQFKRIVFIPGNHDHHFWRVLGEQVHVDEKIRQGTEPPDNSKYPGCFVDERFSSADSRFVYRVIFSDLWPKDAAYIPEFVIKYPHHLTELAAGTNSKAYYLFTHGHFLEDLFKPINYLIEPHHLEELEAFNNLWLEAFDYHIGHAGRLTERAIALEKNHRAGAREARKTIGETMNSVYSNLNKRLKFNWWKSRLIKFGLKLFVKHIPLEKKSGLFKAAIDENLKQNIQEYIETFIVKRYQKGKGEEYHFSCDVDIPTPFTFVFGHTHRPANGKNESVTVLDKTYPLVNTGGWLRDDGETHGENAGILVIDQDGHRWESMQGKLK